MREESTELRAQHERWLLAKANLRAGPPPRRVIAKPVVVDPPIVVEWGVPANLLSSPSYRTIIRLVAAKHYIEAENIVGPSRARRIVAARDEAIALVYTHCRAFSLPELGRLFHRDHTTILHSLTKLRKRRGNYPPTYRLGAPTPSIKKSSPHFPPLSTLVTPVSG